MCIIPSQQHVLEFVIVSLPEHCAISQKHSIYAIHSFQAGAFLTAVLGVC